MTVIFKKNTGKDSVFAGNIDEKSKFQIKSLYRHLAFWLELLPSAYSGLLLKRGTHHFVFVMPLVIAVTTVGFATKTENYYGFVKYYLR